MPDRETVIKGLTLCANGEPCMGEKYHTCPYSPFCKHEYYNCGAEMAADALTLLREQEPRVMTLDEAASAQEVWVEAWLYVPKKYVVMVTILYLTDDCKNFELELLGTSKKAFMLTEEYGHTWRCWTAKPTDEQRQAVKWDA